MSGVLPEEIIYPKLEHFCNARDHSPEIAQIKLRKAIQAREQKLKILVRDYRKIHHLENDGKWDPEGSVMKASQNSQMQPKSAMIELEKQAIEKIKLK